MADDEKTRWAIDVMTAWAHGGADCTFLRTRVDDYLDDSDGPVGLTTGFVNLSGLLLMGMEAMTGRSAPEILQTIAMTVSRSDAQNG